MVNEFLFETFCPEKKKTKNKKQLLLFRCSVAPGNFPLERQEKPCSIYFLAKFPGKWYKDHQKSDCVSRHL